MDCTFCLDCIHACPHENVGVIAGLPGKQLWHDRVRSGIGRLGRRPDLAALVVLLTFAAFINAAGMVAPVLEWRDQLARKVPDISPFFVITLCYALGLLVSPCLLIGIAAVLSRILGRLSTSSFSIATRFSYSLIPIGFAMWLAHYSFHFLTGYEAIVPCVQRFAADLGWFNLGEPNWAGSCCGSVADWILKLEIVFLDLGLLLSLYTGYRIALSLAGDFPTALKAFVPWAAIVGVLFAAGVWIVLQPMEMRGTLMGGG
jgi:hypothetical protein